MRALLKSVNPKLDLNCLCPHVKTIKSARITRFMMEQGISFYKASLNEVDMLASCGVAKIFVAYPLLEYDARRVADLIQHFPHIKFFVQAACCEHVEILAHVSREKQVKWHYYIDVDVGMSRTGRPVEETFDFFLSIKDNPALEFVGLHAYDGHIHCKDAAKRRKASFDSMARLQKTLNHFAAAGVQVPQCIVAGTPSFLSDVEYWRRNEATTEIVYSPGTWIYFDTTTDEIMPNTFNYAAVILSQVIDKPRPDTATLNLGHKRWAVDSGPVDTFSLPNMKALKWSEEHTIVTVPENRPVKIGDYVMIAPRHVCSTVNLWESFVLVDKNGDIEELCCPIDGRNR
jgi:D-serine deaminase-like pyridoxal phosphate-dependent protein